MSSSAVEGNWGVKGDWGTKAFWEARKGWDRGDSDLGSAPHSQVRNTIYVVNGCSLLPSHLCPELRAKPESQSCGESSAGQCRGQCRWSAVHYMYIHLFEATDMYEVLTSFVLLRTVRP